MTKGDWYVETADNLIDAYLAERMIDDCIVWPHRKGYHCNKFGMSIRNAILVGILPKPNKNCAAKATCGTEKCVNPKHLVWGVRGPARGLTAKQISEVVRLDKISGVALAERYGVHPSTISRYRNKKVWIDVERKPVNDNDPRK